MHNNPMDINKLIKPGLSANQSLVVKDEQTAPHVGSGVAPVLATPVVVNLYEAAALAAIEHLLPQGYQSLGIRLDIEHFAATPKGMRVEVVAKVVSINKRTIGFELSARDEIEDISRGYHERMVVSVDRFVARVTEKQLSLDT